MKALFLYVKGQLSDTPSCSRGYTALAHDIVDWWDRHVSGGGRISDFVRLRKHIVDALQGTAGADFRAIRPSHKRPVTAALDDLRSILQSCDSRVGRMRRVLARLEKYRAHELIADPVIDAPASLHVCYAETGASPESADFAMGRQRGTAARDLARSLQEAAQKYPAADTIVFFDTCQQRYIGTSVGSSCIDALFSRASKLILKDFIVKEKLAPGMPLSILAKRELGPERASSPSEAMWAVSNKLGVMTLIPGICSACGVSADEAINKGVRFRCMRLVSRSTREGVEESACAHDRVDEQAVVGGFVIEPTQTLVDSHVAVVDFCSLYPSIIASENVGERFGLPSIVGALMDRRRETSDVGIARACKLVANSVYGQLASTTSPVYDPVSANAVTSTGRRRLMELVQHISERGGQVVYGDTDSCMVAMPGMTDHEAFSSRVREIVDEYNAQLPRPMKVIAQDVFERSVFLTKKKYIGMRADGSMHYTGTVNVRADSPGVLRAEYETLACELLGGCTVDRAAQLVAQALQRFKEAPAEHLSSVRKLKSLDAREAGGTLAPHIELARREVLREDGLAYTADDSIEFVPCAPLLSEMARARPESWVSETEERAKERSVDWRPAWKMFSVAASGLISAVHGAEASKQAMQACQEQATSRQTRCMFEGTIS